MPVEELADMLSDTSGYTILGYSLQFDGLCPECSKEAEERGA
jgi:Fe2+ or Zn2+ uptake regulation protein